MRVIFGLYASVFVFSEVAAQCVTKSTCVAASATPKPANRRCGEKGVLSQVGDAVIRDVTSPGSTPAQCAQLCQLDVQCQSFAFGAARQRCRTFRKTLDRMGFSRSALAPARFWHRSCFTESCQTTVCGSGCESAANDPLNCGGCGVTCPSGVCNDGVCACPAPQNRCDGTCVDTRSDPLNCGYCGRSCPSGTCNDGSCKCLPSETTCSGNCVDTATDPFNCGGCDNYCSSGKCNNGTCGCQASGYTRCSDGCTDLLTNYNNCGSCGTVCQYSSCTNGECYCPPGKTNCNNSCKDLKYDAENCGSCGNRCPSGVCTAGSCDNICDASNNVNWNSVDVQSSDYKYRAYLGLNVTKSECCSRAYSPDYGYNQDVLGYYLETTYYTNIDLDREAYYVYPQAACYATLQYRQAPADEALPEPKPGQCPKGGGASGYHNDPNLDTSWEQPCLDCTSYECIQTYCVDHRQDANYARMSYDAEPGVCNVAI